jgi:phenylacetate-coenzyme A ligase PaaK-like adenylate-forming protein
VTWKRLLPWINDTATAGSWFDDTYLVATTSGTTGNIGVFLNDKASWGRTRAILFARLMLPWIREKGILHFGPHRPFRAAFVVATGGHFMTALLGLKVPGPARVAAKSEQIAVQNPFPEILRRLNQLMPHLLHCYPSTLELLARAKIEGALNIEPELITMGSEHASLQCRNLVKEAFPKAQMRETYACTECVPLAVSCSAGMLHLNEDACIIECVNQENQPTLKGEWSHRVLLTNLLNHGQPLIRYALEDRVRMVEGDCACGSPFLRIQVQGRTDDTLYFQADDGHWQAHSPIPIELQFLGVPRLKQYQVYQPSHNKIEIRFVCDTHENGNSVAARLDDNFKKYLQQHQMDDVVSYVIEEVPAIVPSGLGHKIRKIISEIAPPKSATLIDAPQVRRK